MVMNNDSGVSPARKAPSQTEPISYFNDAAKVLKIEPKRLAVLIGYHVNVYHVWSQKGIVPKVALLAVRGLVKREEEQEKQNKVYIVRAAKHNEVIVQFLNALEVDFTEV